MDVELKFSDLEIYNWKELSLKYDLKSLDEKSFLNLFLLKFGFEKIDEIKGGYAFVAVVDLNKYCVFRDVVGIKPVCLFFDESKQKFEFASSLNDLPLGAFEMNPRKYVEYDTTLNEIKKFEREKFYDVSKRVVENYSDLRSKVFDLFLDSVSKRVKRCSGKIGVLFSGGTDSTLMALTLKKLGVDFTCYTASIVSGNISEGEDIFYARKIVKECSFNWKLCELEFAEVEERVREVCHIIGSKEYTKVSVALPLYVALQGAKEDGVKDIFTGIGSEEIFADYKRRENIENINETCIEGLKSLWIRDLYRDDMLAKSCNINLRYPFLDDDFVDYSIRIIPEFKIDKIKGINKVILRDILRDLGLSEEMVSRKKKAAQYGSRSDRVFEKIAKKKKLKKQEYLNSL